MIISKNFYKILTDKLLTASVFLLIASGCNEQEFYKKEFLEGVGVPDEQNVETSNEDSNSNDHLGPTSNIDDKSDHSTETTVSSDTNTNNNTTTTDNQVVNSGSNGGSDTDSDSVNNSGSDSSNNSTAGPGSNDGSSSSSDPVSDTDSDTTQGICGTGNPTNTSDTFIQNSAQAAKVDILWVVDNSGSMGNEQDSLAKNFDIFIDEFIQKDIDFTMGITTTDNRYKYAGDSYGELSKLTSSYAKQNEKKFKEYFKRKIKVGTNGSGNEKGLSTAQAFLKRNPNFVRQDSYLIIVFISDEEEQSSGKVITHINNIKQYKDNGGFLKAYSIVTKDKSLSRRWETVGTRYIEASNITNAKSSDIHEDFYVTLRDMGGQILDLVDSFPLSGIPINAEIKITINGIEVSSGWSYNEESKIIKFNPNAIPEAGSVTIAYYQKCVSQ